MNIYAESSAVLAWLLGQPLGSRARASLAGAEAVVSSELTLIECDRALIRYQTQREITEAVAADSRAVLNEAAAHWHLLRMSGEILDRARRPFPAEPIRTLDALHLSTALVARGDAPALSILSLDDRIRRVATLLGFQVTPSAK